MATKPGIKKPAARLSSGLTDGELLDAAKSRPGVLGARVIPPADVITAAWVKMKCRFGCDGYGQCLVCPPFTPTAEETRRVLDGYRRAVLIHFGPGVRATKTVAALEREIFLKGAWKAFGLGCGPCDICKECPVEKGLCRFSERARPAMEACGIDVFSTARKAGFPIEVVRTYRQTMNRYGLILID